MAYALLREAKVVVVSKGRAYYFDALANVSTSLSYEEYKSNRRTLHRKTNYPTSRVTMQNPSTVSLAVNLTDNLLETKFFDWLGMEKQNSVFSLPYYSKLEPEFVDVYIINKDGLNILVKKCCTTSIDFTLENNVPLLNIALEGAEQIPTRDYPPMGSLVQGNILPFSPLSISINSKLLPGVIGTSLSFQQQCNWRDERSIHDIGTVYTHKRAYITEMNVSSTINLYYTKRFDTDDTINSKVEYDIPLRIFNRFLDINLPSCRITKRLDVTDVYTIAYDIIPMEYSDPVTIKFIGE